MEEKSNPSIIPIALLGLGFALIGISAFFILRNVPLQAKTDLSAVPVKVNFASPELTLTNTEGVTQSLTDYRGKIVLVNLWATWCPPCKKEMPTLEAYYNKYKDDGFVIVAINDGDPEADVHQFVEEYRLTFPVWLDPTYIATEQAFKTINLPTSYIIDRDGTVKYSWVGEINRKNLEKYVTPLIKDTQ